MEDAELRVLTRERVNELMVAKPSANVLQLADGIDVIAENTFIDCISVRKIIVSEGVKAIDSFAFSECTALEEVVLPESVTQIGLSIFFQCRNLKKVVVPEGSFASTFLEGIVPLEIRGENSVRFVGLSEKQSLF